MNITSKSPTNYVPTIPLRRGQGEVIKNKHLINTQNQHIVNYNKSLKPVAKKLRQEMTKSEVCLWKYAIGAKQMKGYTFNRQRPIGNYVADFVCKELMIIIELDGISHCFEEIQEKDKQKENFLKSLGYKVLRFSDEEVLKDMRNVMKEIEYLVEEVEGENRDCAK